MHDRMDRLALIDRIEAAIHRDVGRNTAPLFAAAQGGLRGAGAALAGMTGAVGLITGFYVPAASPPAAETDGPVGVALLARALRSLGIACRVCTDAPCAPACLAALAAAGVPEVPIDVVPLGGSTDDVIATWRAQDVRLAVAIERCGRSADGRLRNMRGQDIDAVSVALDGLFLAGPWSTIAIGDGGNEIGMGALPDGLIADHVANGATIGCVTPADHLVVAGVSHWGVYALLGALAALRPDWRDTALACLDPALDLAVLEATVRNGPAVDGITGRHEPAIDAIAPTTHHEVLAAIRLIIAAASAPPGSAPPDPAPPSVAGA
jgi:hypothetical protein